MQKCEWEGWIESDPYGENAGYPCEDEGDHVVVLMAGVKHFCSDHCPGWGGVDCDRWWEHHDIED